MRVWANTSTGFGSMARSNPLGSGRDFLPIAFCGVSYNDSGIARAYLDCEIEVCAASGADVAASVGPER